MPLHIIVIKPSGEGAINFLARCVMLQNRKRMHPALSKAFMMLIILATCEESLANCENRLPTSMKKGAPGGWPISRR
jgi:hypothetical protein